ncbi:xylulokinase, partial [Cryobacterium fucosi]
MSAGGETLLGIDLGTSSVKVALFDPAGRRLAGARAAYPLDAPRPGWAETNPRAWWAAVCAAVREVTAASERNVGAIGLSGQMHGLVLVDGRGDPVRPAITWADTRAAGLRSEWARLAPAVLGRLGNPFSPGMAGVLLGWLARHEPERLRAASVALQPKDYLRLRLTGLAATEHTDASATLLYDLTTRAWLTDLAVDLRIDPALLPRINEAAEIAGPLTTDAAADLGLRAGIPVAHGLADTAAAMLGSGLVTPGTVQLTLGTGGQFVTPVAAPAPAAERGIHSYAAESGWYEMAAILGGGLALDWVRRLLGYEWPEFYDLAARPIGPGAPLFLPHLVGERTPYLRPDLRGAWVGLDLGHDRSDLARAALEGVALALRTAHAALGGRPAGDLWLAGGGTT